MTSLTTEYIYDLHSYYMRHYLVLRSYVDDKNMFRGLVYVEKGDRQDTTEDHPITLGPFQACKQFRVSIDEFGLGNLAYGAPTIHVRWQDFTQEPHVSVNGKALRLLTQQSVVVEPDVQAYPQLPDCKLTVDPASVVRKWDYFKLILIIALIILLGLLLWYLS
jgi:hypothetical protein